MISLIRPEPGKSTAMPLNVSYGAGRIADVVSGRLPRSLRDVYQDYIRFFDQTPGLRRFGVSMLVIARRDGQSREAGSSSG
jgi:hypothetical protein